MNVESSPQEASLDSGRPLRVVVAYGDVAAGQRAVVLVHRMAAELQLAESCQILPWAFRLLNDEDWHGEAATDAIAADILIIAASTAPPLPLNVTRWLDTVIHRKRGSDAALVALLGVEEDSDRRDATELLDAIRQAAGRAGLDFFPASPRSRVEEIVDRIQERSETVTPVLEKILQLRRLALPTTKVPYPR